MSIEFGSSFAAEFSRKKRASEHGLPETATWEEIQAADTEVARKKRASEHGLPETATWEEIQAADDEVARKKRASERGPQGNKEDSMGFEETGN